MFMMVWHGYKHSLLGYTYNVFDFKVEGTWVKAEGNQGSLFTTYDAGMGNLEWSF